MVAARTYQVVVSPKEDGSLSPDCKAHGHWFDRTILSHIDSRCIVFDCQDGYHSNLPKGSLIASVRESEYPARLGA